MSTSLFFSENNSLERDINVENKATKLSDIWNPNELNRCIKFTREGSFASVCLQFSDDFINYSVEIEKQLKKHIDSKVYLLADTSYGSCCVDEIAAAHVQSDSIIHFGHACLSKVTRLPVLYVFPKNEVSVDKFIESFKTNVPDKMEKVYIFYDVGSFHSIDAIANKLHQLNYINIEIGKLADDGTEPEILCWSIKSNQNTENCICVFIGYDNQSFFNISMSIKCKKWYLFDIEANTMREVQAMNTKFLMRRNHYVEKCKDAQTIGIVVGTLTTKGYLDIIKHIQELAIKRNVKTFIFSVGKVNPAKLANFSDVDCFVLVGCSENNLYNSRDFYKPLISVFEAEMALNPAWAHQVPDTYSTDFREVLPEGKLHKSSNEGHMMEADISLITGKVRGYRPEAEGASNGENFDGTVQERSKQHLAELSSFSKFQDRTFRGLDPALGKNEPSKIEQGRKGIPIKYDEKF